MNSKKSLSPEQIELAYVMWCNGYTQKQIASQLYVSERTLRRAFNGRKKKTKL